MDSVASRYAIALLNIAREERKIKEYVDEVEQIGNLLSQNKDLLTLLKDYGLSTTEKKNLLTSIFENKISEYILNLLYVLIDNKRGSIILSVCDEFVRIGLNELNIKKENVMAIGDNINDKMMIENAGLGISMKGSSKEVLDIADYITEENNDEDGAAKALEKFI